MPVLHRLLSPIVQVREEESITLFLMFLYSFLAMTAYTIIKPLATGTFIATLGAENIPIMILVAGPLIAVIMQVYTAAISKLPQRWVIQATQAGILLLLVSFSFIFQWGSGGLSASAMYLFRLILGVLLLSQFWTLANDIYDARQAKRFFGFIGGGSALGGLTASFLVQQTVEQLGFNNLLLVSATLVACCMALATAILRRTKAATLTDVSASGKETGVGGTEAFRMLRESKHLQVIAVVIGLASMGASLIETQLNLAVEEFAGAGEASGISALLATVQLYTSVAGFLIQVFLTSAIHRHLGIGIALLLLPISLGGTAVAILISGALWSSMLARILDASLRYSADKTTREILFMPLPTDLKYQAKPFVDVTVVRVSQSAINILILVLIKEWGFALGWPQLSIVSLIVLVLWVYMAVKARQGYLAAFRRSLEERDVKPSDMRLDVSDSSTVETLVEELAHPDEERVLYAIDVLESLGKQNLVTPLLLHHSSTAVRARALAALGATRPAIAEQWVPVIQDMIKDENTDVRAGAIGALAHINNEDATAFARTLLSDDDPRIVATAAVALSQSGVHEDEEAADRALSALAPATTEGDARVRQDLAAAIRHVGGDDCRHLLIPLLHDTDPGVAAEAMRSVRALASSDHLFTPTLIALLGNRELKSDARETLVGYGSSVVPMLGHFMQETEENIWVRRHIPATLARIPCQESMDVLMTGLTESDGFLQYKSLAAFEKLNRDNSHLTFESEPIEHRAIIESDSYFRWLNLYYSLFVRGQLPIDTVLAHTLNQKMSRRVDRIYLLLGLLHPWKDIAAARWSIDHGTNRAKSSAFEYLDNILNSHFRNRLMPVLEDLPLDEKVSRGNAIIKARPTGVEDTLRELINDEDQIVAAAAIDLVREQQLWSLADDVESVLANRDPKDWYVFEAASWTLASQHLSTERRRELWLEPLPAVALVERLRTLPMFGSVGIDELFRIAGAAEQTRHELDTSLLQEDTVPDNLYVLLDGRIEASARRAVPWEIVPPATLGLEEVLNGSVMSHTLKTLEPSVTLKLSSQVMGTLLADNTDLVQGFFRTLTGRGPSSAEIPAIMKGEAEQELLQLSAGQLTPIQKVLALQRISIFSRVSASEMRHLAEIARQVELLEGELLAGETDPPLVCILLSGSLSVETPGGLTPAQQATAGDAVGMHEALAGTSSGKTGTSPKRLTVLEAGAALRIDSDDLFDLLGQRPNLLQQIFSALFGTKAQAS